MPPFTAFFGAMIIKDQFDYKFRAFFANDHL